MRRKRAKLKERFNVLGFTKETKSKETVAFTSVLIYYEYIIESQ
jgi:hypothetical protein